VSVPVVQVRDLVKRYGEIAAVHGINFDVTAGETFGFLGRNGAGKSTTIKIRAGRPRSAARHQLQDVRISGRACHVRAVHSHFSAASIVWDREFGFLREMLVAPVSRSAIVIGKCLGGATVATF
jgi:ABC-type branched-subunit amino acid transport system ATPase component